MSLALYDAAFTKKLNQLTEKTDIHVYSPEESKRLFEIIADESNDAPIKLPIIRLSRSDGYTIKERGNTPRSKNSLKVTRSEDGNSSYTLNTIPIGILYLIDVYSRKFAEADAIMREIIFILTNQPSLTITIPYNGLDYEHNSNITLDTQVNDSSGIPERLVPSQFSRLTIKCSIDDAYLWDVRLKPYIQLSTNSKSGLLIISPNISDYGTNSVLEPLDFGTKA